ncbi:RICIN domain-containing protein [Mucilaginibacter xinganensis]|uniref:Ricin B lectin domain-containing protein n=1 Tax=Mucilaginibacter xinganensis TaxID=1234841 RepID=A0A223P353_9SPHI|nr:hypothetical protein [Mucilaginibacter xinganensis]ASU36394.1 hypothetical protein MuYL_4509 [Mucilaginibacter xinganensis]
MKKVFLLISLFLLIYCGLKAQPATFPVTDKQPALVDGLELGYVIKSTEVKAVGNKGDFSRYAVSFYVRNTTNQGKIMLYKQGWNVLNNVSDQLAQFNCVNATGARLTSKEAIINAEACNVLAMVNDCDPKKVDRIRQFVQIGYWIKPGQTISTTAILITPLNTLPDVQVTYLASQLTPLASASVGGPQLVPVAGGQYNQPPPPQQQPVDGLEFVKLKNSFNNMYLNNQQGPPQATNIDPGWWSAQWQVLDIPNSHYVSIKNRWKENYLLVDQRGYVTFTDNYADRAGYWTMETTNDQNVYRFRNLMTGGYLCIAANGVLIQSKTPINNFSSGWLLEQP